MFISLSHCTWSGTAEAHGNKRGGLGFWSSTQKRLDFDVLVGKDQAAASASGGVEALREALSTDSLKCHIEMFLHAVLEDWDRGGVMMLHP